MVFTFILLYIYLSSLQKDKKFANIGIEKLLGKLLINLLYHDAASIICIYHAQNFGSKKAWVNYKQFAKFLAKILLSLVNHSSFKLVLLKLL